MEDDAKTQSQDTLVTVRPALLVCPAKQTSMTANLHHVIVGIVLTERIPLLVCVIRGTLDSCVKRRSTNVKAIRVNSEDSARI